MTPVRLSKSRLKAGLQCEKRLWYEVNAPDLADPMDDADLAVIEQGVEVGELARRLYPGGVLVPHEGRPHQEVVQDTAAALADPEVPAVFEGAVLDGEDPVRADILTRNEDGSFDLLEVKAVSRVRDHEIEDVGYQIMLLESEGVAIRRAYVVHPDREYHHSGGPIAVDDYFLRTDVTEEARAHRSILRAQRKHLRAVAESDAPPTIDIGPHCRKPVKCPFHGTCHRHITDEHVENIAHISNKLRRMLDEAGITDIADIPDDWELSKHQQRWVDMVKSGSPYHDGQGFAKDFGLLEYPLHLFDFEAVNPAVPLWPGRNPYDTTVVQYSNHIISDSGHVQHREHLHVGTDDPELRLIERMHEDLGEDGSIVIFSRYEVQRWRDLAERHPEWASYLQSLEQRVFDLHPVIKRNFADPGLRGSYSLKALYGVLLPGLSYDDLVIQNGGMAAAAYENLIRRLREADVATGTEREALQAEVDEIAENLLRYCERDTWAMLKLMETLNPDLQARLEKAQARGAPSRTR